VAKFIDVDELEEFEPVLSAQMRPVEAQGKQWLPLRHVLGLVVKKRRSTAIVAT
jgi:hypothetical protein